VALDLGKNKGEHKRWKEAFEEALNAKDEKGHNLAPQTAAAYADSVILQYRLRGVEP
jgi:hypothetical protein